MSTLSGPSRRDNIMGKLNDLAWPPGRPEQRKYRRFSVSYPVHVKFHFEDSVSELQAVTKDVSVGGLLIETASPIPQHCPVDFIMTLHGGPVIRPFQVVGEGDVVRRIEPESLRSRVATITTGRLSSMSALGPCFISPAGYPSA